MTIDQQTAAGKLALIDIVSKAHDVLESNPSFEFAGNKQAWIESHVTNAPDQSDEVKIVHGCSDSMATEVAQAITTAILNA